MENNSNTETVQICRTCTKELANKSLFFNLDFTHADTELTIRQKLYGCIPELDLSIVPNAVICYECADIVTSIYKFKNDCLQTETKIHKYIQHIQRTDNVVDLIQALHFHHQPYENLRTEFEAIENFKADESTFGDTNNTCNEAGKHTEFMQNEYLLSIEKADVQIELFNTDDNLITYSKSEHKENLGLDGSIALNNIPVNEQDNYIQNIKKDISHIYQCYTCGHKTESRLKLIVHIKRHSSKKKKEAVSGSLLKSYESIKLQPFQSNSSIENNKVKCGNRSYSKRNSNNQSKHIICKDLDTSSKSNVGSHMLKKLFKCSVCEYQCSRKSNLKRHMQIHTDVKPFKCSVCDYQCTMRSTLKIHMRMHTGEKPFKCQICEYQSSRKNNLKIHMQIHTGEKPIKCPVCEYQCTTESRLKIHVRIHTGEKPFKCQFCEYQSSRTDNLKIHMQTHTSEKPFKCAVCEYQCNQKNHLKMHMQKHTGEKSFKCQICEYQCSQKSDLKIHLRIHTDEKLFKCQICEYQCSQKSNLSKHMRIHTGEKPFKCQICEYRSSLKNTLKIHMRVHTGEKPFKCPICEYQCSLRGNLKIHMQTHTDKKPFKCAVCEYKCRQKNKLKIHNIRMHSK